MHELAALLMPTALFALCALALAGVAFASLQLFVVRPQRRAAPTGLLREPAHALRRRLEVVDHRMTAAAVAIGLTLFFWGLFYPAAAAAREDFWGTVIHFAAGAVALGWFAQELLRLWPERLGLKQAIAAQTQTALSLNLLMRQKYWVFHDVHIAGHRINHLVIGPRGVFCISSIWRRVSGRLGLTGRKPPAKREALFDGRALHFPGWEETEVLEEPEQLGKAVGAWLANAMREAPENLPTHGALALPGWKVTSTNWKRLLVFNPSTPNMLIQGAPEGRRIDTTTSQALLKVLRQHHEEVVDARLRNPLSAADWIREAVKRVLGRPV